MGALCWPHPKTTKLLRAASKCSSGCWRHPTALTRNWKNSRQTCFRNRRRRHRHHQLNQQPEQFPSSIVRNDFIQGFYEAHFFKKSKHTQTHARTHSRNKVLEITIYRKE